MSGRFLALLTVTRTVCWQQVVVVMVPFPVNFARAEVIDCSFANLTLADHRMQPKL